MARWHQVIIFLWSAVTFVNIRLKHALFCGGRIDSIHTEITKPGQLENKLSIANATINDGGNYTCSLDSFSFSIVVHFLKGEFFLHLICAVRFTDDSFDSLFSEEKQAASQHATNGGRLSLALHSLNQGLVRHLLLSFLLQIVIHNHHLFRVVR